MTAEKAKIADDHDANLGPMLGRRGFLKILGKDLGLIATIGALGGIATLVEVTSNSGLSKDTERLRCLRNLFGIGEEPAVLVPAADHPFKGPVDDYWYHMDRSCSVAYQKALYPDLSLAKVNAKTIDAHPQDTLVMFGSQVSNAEARSIFGNPWKERTPHFRVVPGKLGSGWQANLRWNLYCSESMKKMKPLEIRIPESPEIWKEEPRVILDAKHEHQFGATVSPEQISDGETVDSLKTDFLLVTVLPRHGVIGGQKIISFAGLYGPGMSAAKLLFSSSTDELKRLEKETEAEPYYQALYRVTVETNNEDKLVPVTHSLYLEGATPLLQTNMKGGEVILSAR